MQNLVRKKFNLNESEALISDRLFLNNKTFHSKIYSRRGECNSYSVSFEENTVLKYAEIEYFLEINGSCYELKYY